MPRFTTGRLADIRVGEGRLVVLGATYFFFVMTSWFILRPIRDELAVAAGISKLPWLFTGTLAATLVCQPLFAALVRRLSPKRFIPIAYRFFLANLLGFYALTRWLPAADQTALGLAFFWWTNVFNLFVISVFWGFMADVCDPEQARRLFGLIAIGGTIGAIVGTAVTASLVERIGTVNLFLASAVLLELAVQTVRRFPERTTGTATPSLGADPRPVGGGIWAGLTHVARSRYLAAIALYLVLYTIGSTFLYFEQADIVGRQIADRAARTAFLAWLELGSQSLTALTQGFVTGRMMKWLGVGVTLAVLPLASIGGFVTLATLPTIAVLTCVVVLRRASNFALTNPATEVLFTVVRREDKYKAKSFIETFVYRSGDQIGAWSFAGLLALGLTLPSIALVGAASSVFPLLIAFWLGARQSAMARARADGGDGVVATASGPPHPSAA